jgi:hypothetical protein
LTLAQAERIKRKEFNIISIGVGDVDLDELFEMSSTSDDQYYVENFDKILDIINGNIKNKN